MSEIEELRAENQRLRDSCNIADRHLIFLSVLMTLQMVVALLLLVALV